MMKRIGLSLLAAIAGYLAGAIDGGWVVSTFSHKSDRTVEAAMTGAFVYGPPLASVAFAVAFIMTGRSRRA
jgi:hypothetical protein